MAQNVLVNQILTWLSLEAWLKLASFGRGAKHSYLENMFQVLDYACFSFHVGLLFYQLYVCLQIRQEALCWPGGKPVHWRSIVCLYVRLSVCLYVCLCVCVYVCLSVCLSICMSVNMSVCLNVCMSVYMCVYMCTCRYARKHFVGLEESQYTDVQRCMGLLAFPADW